MIQRKFNLSTIFDMNKKPLRCKSKSQLPPFLPVKKNDSDDQEWQMIYNTIVKNSKNFDYLNKNETDIYEGSTNCKDEKKDIPNEGWALITGASRGIGRAIAVELARYKVPIILVARSHSKLLELSKTLEKCYDIPTMIIVSDLTKNDAAEQLWDMIVKESNKKGIPFQIDVFIHNAGIGDTKDLVDMDTNKIQDIITVNTTSGSKLCQIFGEQMKQRRRGRIVLISSVTALVPGVPTAGIYAATKAFQRSLAVSIGKEMEPFGVGVTCVCPGAVHDTHFAVGSNMKDASIWKVPFGKLTSEAVARSTIRGMIRGHPETIVGWFNAINFKFVVLLLPERMVTFVCTFAWSPQPFLKK